VAAHSEDFVILACAVLIQITSVTDGRTDGQRDRRPDDGRDARSILLLRVKTIAIRLLGGLFLEFFLSPLSFGISGAL